MAQQSEVRATVGTIDALHEDLIHAPAVEIFCQRRGMAKWPVAPVAYGLHGPPLLHGDHADQSLAQHAGPPQTPSNTRFSNS